jgi:hypothetical protein
MSNIKDLLGQTLTNAENKDNLGILLTNVDGKAWKLCPEQEDVRIEEIIGDLTNLIGNPILMAEEVSGKRMPGKTTASGTWTFYKLATIRGYVTIRFLGTSNGFYSESVSLVEL